LIELAIAYIIGTSEINPTQPKIEIVVGESNVQREAREPLAKSVRGLSYTGNGTVKVIGQSSEQCVIFARRVTGNAKIHGYAGNLQSEGQEPKVGAAVLEKGHVSVLVAISGNMLVVHDANYLRGKITERVVSPNNIRGYIY
jgi:hypothetical protein